MPTITIPKEVAKNKNLIAVPRGTYDEFVAWQKKVKSARVFMPTVPEKKAFARGRKNFLQGKYISLEKLKNELAIDR